MLGACAAIGFHLPRPDATRTLRRTAEALAPSADLAYCLAAYNEQVAASISAVPQRTDRGLFLMTALQAKGKEFDAVVLFPVDSRRWPDDHEHRGLSYVALTRATRDGCSSLHPRTLPRCCVCFRDASKCLRT